MVTEQLIFDYIKSSPTDLMALHGLVEIHIVVLLSCLAIDFYFPKIFWQTGLANWYILRSEAAECSIWSGCTLFATHPADFRHMNR